MEEVVGLMVISLFPPWLVRCGEVETTSGGTASVLQKGFSFSFYIFNYMRKEYIPSKIGIFYSCYNFA